MPLSPDYLEQKVICFCANGQTIETTLAKAAELDQVEGAVVIHVSATMFKMLFDRIAELESAINFAIDKYQHEEIDIHEIDHDVMDRLKNAFGKR